MRNPIQDVGGNTDERLCRWDQTRWDEQSNLCSESRGEKANHAFCTCGWDWLMISNITEDGRIQVIARGGIILATYLGQQVQIKTAQGNIPGVVETCRELTKKHETAFATTLREAIVYYEETDPKGECVLVVGRKEQRRDTKGSTKSVGADVTGRPCTILHGSRDR